MSNEKCKAYAIDLICRSFEVKRDDLLGKKRTEDVVNARCALVHILNMQGVDAVTIERWTGIPPNSQSYLLQVFDGRKDEPWFSHQMKRLIKDAKETSPISFKAHDTKGELVFYSSKYE